MPLIGDGDVTGGLMAMLPLVMMMMIPLVDNNDDEEGRQNDGDRNDGKGNGFDRLGGSTSSNPPPSPGREDDAALRTKAQPMLLIGDGDATGCGDDVTGGCDGDDEG